jgi:hypothetical protein
MIEEFDEEVPQLWNAGIDLAAGLLFRPLPQVSSARSS